MELFGSERTMKDIELKVISELMKNSRRSDRDLAKTLGVSQPTVTRIRTNLEKRNIIKEYTMIPDFTKLGFGLMSIILYRLKPISSKELEDLQAAARELDKQERIPYLLVMDGMGLGGDLVAVSFHKTYSEYSSYLQGIKDSANSKMKPYINMEDVQGFLIDLTYKKHYQPLTFSKIAAHLQSTALDKS
jgi:DNA-binding Lrp family transcriptional regulator